MMDRTTLSVTGDAVDVHRFFWYWFEWVRSPSRRRQTEELTGLPLSASMILWQLIFHGPLSVTEIGRKLGLQKSTVSRQLRPLRDGGLVTETPGRHNKKVSEVSIGPGRRGGVRPARGPLLRLLVQGRRPPDRRPSGAA